MSIKRMIFSFLLIAIVIIGITLIILKFDKSAQLESWLRTTYFRSSTQSRT